MVGSVWYAGLDRERAGRCICGLIVDPNAVSPCTEQTAKAVSGQVAKHKLQYSFSRASRAPGASQNSFSKDALNEKGFADGDMVILSIEGGAAVIPDGKNAVCSDGEHAMSLPSCTPPAQKRWPYCLACTVPLCLCSQP